MYGSLHEIAEASGGLRLNFVKILRNQRFTVILKAANQYFITMIRLIKLK